VVDELSSGAWRDEPEGAANGGGSASPVALPSPRQPRVSEDAASVPFGEAALRVRLAELEFELASLRTPDMRGWLFKFSPEGGSWLPSSGLSSRWRRRYFVVQQGVLKYYLGDNNLEAPRRAVPLSNLVVYDEGPKDTARSSGVSGLGSLILGKPAARTTYHVFSLYLDGTFGTDRGPGSGALLRLSSASSAEARQWIALLEESGATIFGAASGSPPQPVRSLSHSKRTGPLDPFLFPASRPMHTRTQPSLLSHDGQGGEDFSGLINLGLIILFSTHTHLLLENFLKYGLLLELPWAPAPLAPQPVTRHGLPSWIRSLLSLGGRAPPPLPPLRWSPTLASLRAPAVSLLYYLGPLGLAVVLAWLIERAAIRVPGKRYLSDRWANRLHAINVCVPTLLLPCAHVHLGSLSVPAGVVLLLLAATLFMKLVSWAHAHHDLRLANADAKRESVRLGRDGPADLDALAQQISRFATDVKGTEDATHYPQTVTMPRLLYFVVAPTLCYQVRLGV